MFENLEELQSLSETRSEGISSSQLDYLSELNVSDIDWAERNETQQFITLSVIDARMDELGVSVTDRSELAHKAFSIDMAEAYDDYLESESI